MTVKKNRRSSVKYPALYPQYNIIRRKDLLDYDYIGKLNEEEKEFLNKFSAEWICASLSPRGDKNTDFHKTEEERALINKRNNDMNADIYTVSKAYGMLSYFDDLNRHQASLIGTDFQDADDILQAEIYQDSTEET